MLGKFFFSFILFLTLASNVCGQSYSYLEDGKKTLSLMKDGALLQFQTKTNLYALPLVAGTLWYSFEEDKRITTHERSKKISKPVQLAGDFAVVANFPLIPIGAYAFGRKYQDEKLVQFSMEYFATLYLSLLESAAMSLIPIHERPDQTNLSPWETNFRGKSSFPSGHVIPYSALMFKTFQFYGPAYAVVPGILTVLASKQRVQDGKHYLSDVVGGIWLSYFASEGVRAANKYSGNSAIYKEYFEGQLEVGILEYRGVIGPKFTYRY